MTDDRSTAPLDADLDWVRRTLAPADPARPGDRPLIAPSGSTPGGLRLERPRRRPAPKLMAAMAAAALLVLGGVAVAESGTTPAHHTTAGAGPAAVLSAYTATVGEQSAHGRVSVTVGPTSITADGVTDLRTGEGDLTLTLPAPIGPVEVRSTGQDYFIHVPPQLEGAVGGKPWVKVDHATFEGLAGSQLGVPGLGTTLDFSGLLGWLRGVSGQITTIGNETINGTPTTHYQADVDVSRVAAGAGADANAASAAARAVGPTLPVDVWIDAQGRLRQLKVSLDLSTLHLPQGVNLPLDALGPAVLTVDLWDFGATVHPVAPPANQVSDASSLIGALSGRAG